MPTTKITDLTAYTDPVNTDVLPIVDVTSDVTKKVSIADMMKNASLGSAAAPGISFDGDPNTGIYSPGADQVAISTNGTGRLFINSSGRLLVGTSTSTQVASAAEAQFQVQSTTVFASFVQHSNNATGGILALGKSRGTAVDSVNLVQSGDTLATIRFAGADGSDLLSRGAEIAAFVEGTPTTDSIPGRLVFSTTADGGSSPTERLRITSDGKVGVGTTSPSSTLTVAGSAKVTGSTTGQIFIESNSGGYAGSINLGGTGNGLGYTAGELYFGLDNKPVIFANKASSGEAMRITGGGLVGIGTSSVAEKLHVDAGNLLVRQSDFQDPYIKISQGTSTVGNKSILYFADSSGNTSAITGYGSAYGSGLNKALQLSTNGTAAVTIDSSQRVGIGTTSPSVALDCTGAISAQGGNAPTGGFQLPDTSGTKQPRITNDAGNATVIRAGSATGGVKFNNFANSSELATIDNSGRLLVGTSSSVQVYQGATTFNSELQVAGSSASLTIARSVGSGNLFLARNQTVIDGSTLGVISFNGGDGTNIRQAAEISVVVDGTPGTGDMPGRIVLATTADGASSPTERMRISNNGVVTIKNGAVAEIGTLTDAATITPNFASNCNFTVTLGGARTIANPTNVTAGQSGSIFIVQDATGGRTASWGSNWDWAGGTAPTLSTGANAVDRVDYICRSATSIHAVYTGNYS